MLLIFLSNILNDLLFFIFLYIVLSETYETCEISLTRTQEESKSKESRKFSHSFERFEQTGTNKEQQGRNSSGVHC